SGATLRMFETATGKLVWSKDQQVYPNSNVTFTPDGKTVIASWGPNSLHYFNTEDGVERKTLKVGHDRDSGVHVSPDGKRLLFMAWKGAELLNLETGEVIHRIPEDEVGGMNSVVFAPNGSQIITTHGKQRFVDNKPVKIEGK